VAVQRASNKSGRLYGVSTGFLADASFGNRADATDCRSLRPYPSGKADIFADWPCRVNSGTAQTARVRTSMRQRSLRRRSIAGIDMISREQQAHRIAQRQESTAMRNSTSG
jgi:hypothetical protein